MSQQQKNQGNGEYNYSTLIDPKSNGQCAWLKAPYLGHYTGIGHAISVTNYYVKMAARLRLTLFSDFGPTGHQQSAEEVGTYFGFGCLFANSRHPPLNAKVIHVTRENLAAVVDKHRSQLSCRGGGGGGGSVQEDVHTVFDLGESFRGQPTDCDFEASRDIIQQIFTTSYDLYNRARTQTDATLPTVVRRAVAAGDLVVVVHVRRGDVLEAHVRNQRLVNWRKQETGVRAVLKAIERMGAAVATTATVTAAATASTVHRHIRIVVVTEQAPNHDTILDYDLSSGQLSRTNITHALSDVCNATTGRHGCSTYVLTDDEVNALQSFSVLCHALILVATRSGFSHLAAAICPSVRLVVAAPFWCPYPKAGSRGVTGGALTGAPEVVQLEDEGTGAGGSGGAGAGGRVAVTTAVNATNALEEEVWVKMKRAFE